MGALEVRSGTAGFGVEIVGLAPEVDLDDADCALSATRSTSAGCSCSGASTSTTIGSDRSSPCSTARPKCRRPPTSTSRTGRRRPTHPTGGCSFTPTRCGRRRPLWSRPSTRPWSTSRWCRRNTRSAIAARGRPCPTISRTRVESLHAVHVTGQQPRGPHQDELLEPHRDFEWSTTTPFALPHPRTGRTVLYVSEMMSALRSRSSPRLRAMLSSRRCSRTSMRPPTRSSTSGASVTSSCGTTSRCSTRANVRLDGPARTLRKVSVPHPRDGRRDAEDAAVRLRAQRVTERLPLAAPGPGGGMADAGGLNPPAREGVGVRISPWAPH